MLPAIRISEMAIVLPRLARGLHQRSSVDIAEPPAVRRDGCSGKEGRAMLEH
jgi:hypothetical protein